jgi:hypothetical protein
MVNSVSGRTRPPGGFFPSFMKIIYLTRLFQNFSFWKTSKACPATYENRSFVVIMTRP